MRRRQALKILKSGRPRRPLTMRRVRDFVARRHRRSCRRLAVSLDGFTRAAREASRTTEKATVAFWKLGIALMAPWQDLGYLRGQQAGAHLSREDP